MIPLDALVNIIVSSTFLLILSAIDIKTYKLKEGYIPSVIPTIFILSMFLLNMDLIAIVFSFLVGLFLVDLDVFKGLPDWKVIVAVGAGLSSVFTIAIFCFFVTFIGFFHKLWAKEKGKKEIPFIPDITLAYFLTIGVIIFVRYYVG